MSRKAQLPVSNLLWSLIVLLLMPFLLLWVKAATAPPPSSSPSPSPQVPINRTEIGVLLSLRGELGIRSRYWPRKTDPCAVWVGIECESGHVVSITLTGLRRTVSGAMHPAFALDALQNLSRLRVINSSGFFLPGSIPAWFGTLSTLQVIDFSSSSINGSLPPSIGNLSNLQTLTLSHNSLSDDIPASLGNLRNLRVLDLSFNQLSGSIPSSVSNLLRLETLNLGGNHLAGEIPSGLWGLSRLQSLTLNSNDLQGPVSPELGNLSNLSVLDLGSNALSGSIPSELGLLGALNTLTLSNNSLNNTIPTEVSNCTSLQVLSLDHNSLTGMLPPSLSRLSRLSTLDLSSNLFYGTIAFGPANFSKLSRFDASDNYLEGTLPAPFISGAILYTNCLRDLSRQRTLDACRTFYSDRGLVFEGFNGSPSLPAPMNTSGGQNRLGPILGGVFGGIGLVFLIMMLMLFVLKRQKKLEPVQGEAASASTSKKSGPQPVTGGFSVNLLSLGENFSYTQLEQATAAFNASNLLKAGHTGDLYQGFLEGGLPIVVKRVDLFKFKRESYLAELELFGKASHTRLVPLLGHCLEREDEKLLVYKYMPGRDLGFALHRKAKENTSDDTLQSLDWITRLKIAIGAAEGLTYLHHECTPPLVHRDVQASSILLDDKFEVRLGSLTEACVAVGESHHGVFSRILRRQQTSEHSEAGAAAPTCAYDVYCFGKVLLELVSGKLGLSGSTDPSSDSWLEWALTFINVYDKESLSKIMDPNLIVDEDLMEEVWAMAIVAKSCLNPKPSKRPLMRYILKALENPLKVVREDTSNGSARSRTSSHGSWNAALFGSWRHSSSETVVIPGSLREEYLQKTNSKQPTNGGSQGSGQGEVSQRRPGSSEIFPEPVDESVLQAPTNTNSDKQDG